jgi:O-antigen ligase
VFVLVVALPAALVLALTALRYPERFLLFAVLGAMLFPNTIISPADTQVGAADLLLVALLAGWLAANGVGAAPGPWLLGNPMLKPLLAFTAFAAFSLTWSLDMHETLVFLVQLFEIALVIPIAFASLPRSGDRMRLALAWIIGVSCVIALFAIRDVAPRVGQSEIEGAYVLGLHKNVVGSFTGAGFVLAYTLLISRRRFDRVSWLLAAACIVELGGLIASVSRGSMIGTVVAVLAASILLRRQRALTVLVVAATAAMYLSVVGSKESTTKDQSGAYDSAVVRKYSFDNAVEKIKERPVFGTGAGTYSDYIPQLQIGLPDPNNMFLLTWAELGIFGLLILFWLLGTFARTLWRCSRLGEPYSVVGVAAGAVTISFFVHFQFDVTWTRGTTSLAFAMIGILLASLRLGLQARSGRATIPAEQPGPAVRPRARRPLTTARP